MVLDPSVQIALLLPDDDVITVRTALAHQLAAGLALGTPLDEATTVLAREHYFKTWEVADAHGDRVVDRRFEAAADAIVAGDLPTLSRLLAETPALARARSAYGHRQTLLQHVAANGIESARQWQTPANACELARALLDAGAEPDTGCESYAAGDTCMTLLCSSTHPAEARVQGALVETLVAGGARVDGPYDDSEPMWTALVWGYQDAVDALVRCGARLDNLVLAAAAGDLERTKALAAAPRAPVQMGRRGKLLPAELLLEYALIYAASLDRRDVVEWILTQSPDLSIREPMWDATALGIAAHEHPGAGRPDGNPAIVAMLSGRRSES